MDNFGGFSAGEIRRLVNYVDSLNDSGVEKQLLLSDPNIIYFLKCSPDVFIIFYDL